MCVFIRTPRCAMQIFAQDERCMHSRFWDWCLHFVLHNIPCIICAWLSWAIRMVWIECYEGVRRKTHGKMEFFCSKTKFGSVKLYRGYLCNGCKSLQIYNRTIEVSLLNAQISFVFYFRKIHVDDNVKIFFPKFELDFSIIHSTLRGWCIPIRLATLMAWIMRNSKIRTTKT